jgi:hypothetical protein
MKHIIVISTIFFIVQKTNAQNVGIGTNTALQKLHVVGNMLVKDSIGIGVATPLYKLEVAGRMRIRSKGDGTPSESAGIFFNNSTNTSIPRAFLGMIDDNKIGFYGAGKQDFGFAMDKNTGNIFIGGSNTTPTEKLHINGTAFITSKLGVGVLNPTSELEVNGNAVMTGNINAGKINAVRITPTGILVADSAKGNFVTAIGDITVDGKVDMGLEYIILYNDIPRFSTREFTCNCSAGKRVISGGGGDRDFNEASTLTRISFTGPTDNGLGWRVVIYNDYNGIRAFKYWAICAKMR